MKVTCRRSLITILLLLSVWAGPPSSQAFGSGTSLRHVSAVLDWYPNSDHGGLYTAIERGIFRRHHIDMSARVPSDTTAQIRLVAAGSADFGISYETDVLAARARGIPVRSVMCIVQHPLDTVMTLQSSGITRPRQLAGRLIGMAGSPSDQPLVSAMMARDGSSIKKVRLVTLNSDLLPALLSKKVDAVIGVYWTWESLLAHQKGFRVNVMRVERWGVPNYCELVLIAGDSTIRSRPALVRDTVHALQEGYQIAEAHPDVAWTSLHSADETLNRSLVLQSLKLLRPVILDAPTIGYQNPSGWAHYVDWLTRSKVIAYRVKASQAFTNRFLQPRVR